MFAGRCKRLSVETDRSFPTTYHDAYMATTKYSRNELDSALGRVFESVKNRQRIDLKNYTLDTIVRRILALCNIYGVDMSELASRIDSDDEFCDQFVEDLFLKVTKMYRGPHCFASIRQFLTEQYQNTPYLKIWHAGCSTGEEVYSMVILLKEIGLYEKSLIYATDISHKALEQARSGIYSAEDFKKYCRYYFQSAGVDSLSSYFTTRYGYVRMNSSLTERVIFARHDLINESPFTDAHIIFCRNVLIYMNPEIRSEVLMKLDGCLYSGGALVLGEREGLFEPEISKNYGQVYASSNIYHKLEKYELETTRG